MNPDGRRETIALATSAEVIVVTLRRDQIVLVGTAPERVRLEPSGHPSDAVERHVRERYGEPRVLHSTSWRHDDTGVVLTFVAVVDPETLTEQPTRRPVRAAIARSEPTDAPPAVSTEEVIEHALRHLAWLAHEDPVIAGVLTNRLRACLGEYLPEPFRALN